MNNPIIVPMCLSEPEVIPMTVSENETFGFDMRSAVVIAPVKGVKGSAEADFRTGYVSISPADLGIDMTGVVVDSSYVHTDNNFTNELKSKLDGLFPLDVKVNGDDYRITNFVKGTWNGVPGLGLFYDDGSLDGDMIFIADADSMTSFEAYLDGKFATFADLPTQTGDLINDSGFITGADVPSNETDPTVPGWAKASTKPSYTASEVGALPDTTVIPSETSQLNNDSGFITSSDLPTNVSDLNNDVPYAKANTDGAAFNTMAIPMGAVDSTSTSTVYTATVDGITELKTGVCMMLSNHVVTSASGFTININNLGAKPCYSNMTNATRDTTIFNVAYTMLFVYDESLDSGDGGWWCYRGYNSDNNTIGYVIRTNSSTLPMDSVTYRYRLLFSNMNADKWIPANNSTSTNATASRTVIQTPIDPFGRIVYYGTTTSVAAGSRPGAAYLFDQQALSLGYSFNRTGAALTLTTYKPVWLKTAPQSDGSVIIDSTTPYVQDLPTTEDGKVYILLGVAYSATNIELTLEHPVKHYKDGAIRNWWG